MKKILIVLFIFIVAISFSQEKPDDLKKVKDALVNQVLYTQELEKQIANLNATLLKVAEDLKNVNTIRQLDSIKVVYGIAQLNKNK